MAQISSIRCARTLGQAVSQISGCLRPVASRACRHVTRCSSQDQIPVSKRAFVTSAAILLSSTAAASSSAAAECALQTSQSGLQYCDVVEGTGPAPVKGAIIRCHYTGRLASNNTVFDSSYERGRPLSFKIGVREVIAGWDEGILGGPGIPPMKEGGKRKLVIPSELAYGERGAGRGVIPPNATLIFDVELLAKR